MFQKQCRPDDSRAQKSGFANTTEHHHAQSPSEIIDEMETIFFSDFSNDVDPDLVDKYLEQLDKVSPIDFSTNVEQSRVAFNEKHAFIMNAQFHDDTVINHRKHRRGLKSLVIAAAIICTFVIFGTVAYATVPDSPFAQWIAEAFSFGAVHPDDYHSLQEALDDYGINDVVLPSWLPPDYALTSIAVDEMEAYTLLAAQYAGIDVPENTLVITVKEVTPQGAMVYEKDELNVVEHIHDGITFYITSNRDMCSILWYTGDYECCISGVIKEEEVSAIIDSIE